MCSGSVEVQDAIAVFAEARRTKATKIGWNKFWRECLVEKLGFKMSRHTMLTHVQNCIGCDS